MKVYHGLENIDPPIVGAVLTVGNFDGVHRGHQKLLAQAGMFAAGTGGPVAVLTFEPHPARILAPERAPVRLTPLAEKIRLLGKAGADIVSVARVDREFLAIDADDFVDRVIRDRFHPTHVVEGPTFRFGRGRRGTPELLRDRAARFGCHVHVEPPVTLEFDGGDRQTLSSTLVRKLLADGDVRRAAMCLGRRYALLGEVVHGRQRGRGLGFPTANVRIEEQAVPREGVYAGLCRVEPTGEWMPAAVSVGRTPTFDGSELLVEAHLLDFSGELYGQTVRLEFDRFLRSQQRYASPEDLARQVAEDVRRVREVLAGG